MALPLHCLLNSAGVNAVPSFGALTPDGASVPLFRCTHLLCSAFLSRSER